MYKAYDIFNNELKENINYIVNGSTLTDFYGKIHIFEYSSEDKSNILKRGINMIGKLLCRLGFHYKPITRYKNGKKVKWYEFWIDHDEADIYMHCQRCGKL